MIIGNGFLAKEFQKLMRNDVIVFASGVSNSKLIDNYQYLKEETLLKKVLSENILKKTVVYFSTYSIDDPSLAATDYIIHKKAMETVIQSSLNPYLIIRTSNLVGNSNNPFTIINYLNNKITKGEKFDLWINAFRNLLDIEHLFKMAERLLVEGVKNEMIYLVCPIDYDMLSITKTLSLVLDKEPNYSEVKKGAFFIYDKELSSQLFSLLNISTDNYLEKLLKKYFLK